MFSVRQASLSRVSRGHEPYLWGVNEVVASPAAWFDRVRSLRAATMLVEPGEKRKVRSCWWRLPRRAIRDPAAEDGSHVEGLLEVWFALCNADVICD